MQETLPMKRSETGLRSSKRLKNSFIVEKTRTNLRKNSFLVKYSYLNYSFINAYLILTMIFL